jgi:rhodanese-related sulfurtransferase
VLHGVTSKPTRIPLAGPANRQGRLAGEHAASGTSAPRGRVIGTAIVNVFDVVAGVTGLGERAAIDAGYDVEVSFVLPNHHAGYFPGARSMRIKLIHDRGTRKVLGAQVVGAAGVDKRLDVVATLMHFGGTIDDLARLDLSYAPQFGSAKDAIHLAAFVATNQQDGISLAIHPRDLTDQHVLIDVRTEAEFKAGTLVGARHVAVDELRSRIGELDPTRTTIVFCAVGQRGHVAQRILCQAGFVDARNLMGGFQLAREHFRTSK